VFDPDAHGFFDPAAVDRELRRVADVCHGCRRCYNLCPSFDVLFRALDRPEVDGETERLEPRDLSAFSDLCFQCRLCLPQCPYSPPHRWDVDVPRVVLRDRATRVRQAGRPALRERLLSSADAVGRVGTAAAPVVNALQGSRAARVLIEKTLGLHRDRLLPVWSARTFGDWWAARGGATRPSPPGGTFERVALFSTCSVDRAFPEVGRAAVGVLERNGCEVVVPEQRCCGMPALENGDLELARECRTDNVRSLWPFARAGYTILVPGPTCSLTLRKEYPLLDDDAEAREVAGATLDLCEFLMRRHAAGRLSTDFERSPGKIVYQVPCHLKVQDIGFRSRDLLRLIPGAEVTTVERCTGHDGTWSMKTENFPRSMDVGRPVFEELERAAPDRVATDCPLAGIQIRQGTGRTAKHPIQILAEAYGLRDL
jgi:Fe-S oxidoreductase